MFRGCEGVCLDFNVHQLLSGDTIHSCLEHSVNCGLHMSNGLSFVRGDVFIGIISYHYI